MKKLTMLSLRILLLSIPLLAFAAEPVPDAGIRAEMQKRWSDAIEVYQKTLKQDPRQVHLWLRIADIQVHLGNQHAAADAIAEATRHAPKDPVLFYRLSQVRAGLEQPKEALAAINRAVELDPDNVEYLRGRAMHANWNGDYKTGQDSFRRILKLKSGDKEAMLGLARSYSWEEAYDKAAPAYRKYVEKQPQDKKALMEYIEVEAEQGNYPAAAELGARYRKKFGEDLDYWLHMADIYALSGNDRASVEAIEQASRYAKDDPKLFFRISQSYPSIEDAKPALAAIKRALELDPDNLEYIRAQADLATWSADYETAMDSYHRILAIVPGDAGALLGIARVYSWDGKTDEAMDTYKIYLDKYPQVQVAWIEYIELHTQNGNYAVAMELLEEYRQSFGETNAYIKQRARVFVWAQQPRRALGIVSILLPEMPDDYHLNMTRTIALRNNSQPREAVDSLAEVIRLDPDSQETESIQRYVKTPLRSYVSFLAGYQTDTDDVTIKQFSVEGVYVVSPETRFWLAGAQQQLDALIGSGLDNIDGTGGIDYTRAWIGARHLFSSTWSLDANIGNGSVQDGDDHFIYEVGADIWPRDGLSMRLSRNQDIYAVSPRAVSLDIVRRVNQLDFSWTPNLRYTVDGLLSYSTFSDNNNRWDVALAPRRAMLRSQHFTFDLGVGAHWFGFDTDPGNGYYSPTDYRRYSITAFAGWWKNEDDGINLTISVGPYKDNTMSSYHAAGDVTIKGTVGVYRDWMLEVSGSLSQNAGEDTGAYRSRSFELKVTRRF